MENWLSAILQGLSVLVESGQAPVKLGAGNQVLISQSVDSGRIRCGTCLVIACAYTVLVHH